MRTDEFVCSWLAAGTAVGEVPLFGSPEWFALPDYDVRRVASAVRAAEAWRRDGEVDALTAAFYEVETDVARRWRAVSYDVAAGDDWIAESKRSSHAELERRRSDTGPESLPVKPWTAEDLDPALEPPLEANRFFRGVA